MWRGYIENGKTLQKTNKFKKERRTKACEKVKFMIQITLATSAERKSVLATSETTLQQIINDNNIDTTGATIMLKGNVVSAFDLDRTLAQCGVEDGSSVIMNVAVKAAAAFEVKVENNVLTVITDITQDVVESGVADLVAYDESGNAVYGAGISGNGKASFNGFSFTGNTYIDGKLAATMILPMGIKQEEMQKFYGEDLLKAKQYTEQIQETAADKIAEIAALFPVEEEVEA